MRRLYCTPRVGWQAEVEAQGLVYNTTDLPDGGQVSYWREGVHYDFTSAEQAELETTVALLDAALVEVGDVVVADRSDRLFDRLHVPQGWRDLVRRDWEVEPPSVYQRYDVVWGGAGTGSPAMLEVNADTPTSLVESAVVQWNWFLESGRGQDQWNGIHEQLTEAWRRQLGLWTARHGRPPSRVHLAWDSGDTSGEDRMTVSYMADTVMAAGYEQTVLTTAELQLDGSDGRFYDPLGHHVDVVFALYPWEWLVGDAYGDAVAADLRRTDGRGTTWVEPVYKMLWSNKGVLPLLWERFADQPEVARHLLPAFFADDPARHQLREGGWASKPLLGREGANVELFGPGGAPLAAAGGRYGAEGRVWQALRTLPDFPGPDGSHHPVLGLWSVDHEPAGMGIRESAGLITDDLSHFVPHTLDHRGGPPR